MLGSLIGRIPLKLFVAGGLSLAIIIGGAFAYRHYTGVLSDRVRLRAEVVELTNVTQEQEEAIEHLQFDIQLKDRAIIRLNDRQNQLREQEELLRSRLSDLLRGIDATPGGQPESLRNSQNAINTEMSMRLRCVELSTGAPLTEAERNGEVSNTVCPELIERN